MAERRGMGAEYLIPSEKVCPRCGGTFPLEQFARDAHKPGGRKSLCKPCDRAKARAYYAAHRDRVLARVNARNARRRAQLSAGLSKVGRLSEVTQLSAGLAEVSRLTPEKAGV